MNHSAVNELNDWILKRGLKGVQVAQLITDFCQRVRDAGIDLEQSAIFMDTLHPVLESEAFFWDRGRCEDTDRQQFYRPDAVLNLQRWNESPFHYVLDHGLSEIYLSLPDELAQRFPVILDLQDAGHTGYFILIHPLGEPSSFGEMDSLYSRWSTKRPGGFSQDDLEFLRRTVPALALCIKAAALRQVTGSLVELYLGRDAGRLVLAGRIERGKVDSINAILWFSDMINFTALSERTHGNDIIGLLAQYAGAVISAVHDSGGEVLKLIGDGVLAIFKQADEKEAATAALAAWSALELRLEDLNGCRDAENLPTTSIYAGLHVGEVFYGNVGSDDRLDFTVIGPAVNVASRIAASCHIANRDLLISDEFLQLLEPGQAAGFDDLGRFSLKGVSQEKRLHGASRCHRRSG